MDSDGYSDIDNAFAAIRLENDLRARIKALEGKLQAAETLVARCSKAQLASEDEYESRIKSLETRLDAAHKAKTRAEEAELACAAELDEARSRLDDAADMIANAVANHDGGGSCTLDAVRAAVWLRDVERHSANCTGEHGYSNDEIVAHMKERHEPKLEGGIWASCGHKCGDEDGEDGMGTLAAWKSEECDAITGFHAAVSYGSLCNKCLAEYRQEGLLLDTEADELAYLSTGESK